MPTSGFSFPKAILLILMKCPKTSWKVPYFWWICCAMSLKPFEDWEKKKKKWHTWVNSHPSIILPQKKVSWIRQSGFSLQKPRSALPSLSLMDPEATMFNSSRWKPPADRQSAAIGSLALLWLGGNFQWQMPHCGQSSAILSSTFFPAVGRVLVLTEIQLVG